ncbi:MAG: selenocysteine-specific translation elongation factor [Streptosporangiales bacterium]|nr:selenocysteine-specific translation elongation factor [Streptosporangiales bacterium]
MHVIATAGHVDHGKSTLVRALSGMEPDRWAEERRRGLTIDLGYAWTTLPSGERLAFVDVPGHERFVTNMLAGVGPVPAVMMVVAADEGWKPQSAEHLAAIDALGVRHGLLVVSRADICDPEEARRQALAEIRDTSLGDVESVVVSGLTGQGIDLLWAALERLAAGLPEPKTDAPVRFWIDRSFTIRGSGTVVTGTLPGGRLRVGDELVLAPTGRRARIRALQSLKESAEEASAVARVAVNIRGLGRTEVGRGMALVTPGRWYMTNVVDVRLRGDEPSSLPRELIFHIGAAGVAANVRPLGPDSARLVLASPLPLHIGDRALLRDPGRHRIPAGVTILDVRPPPLRRRGAAAARARELARLDGTGDGAGDGTALLRRFGFLRGADLVAMGCVPPNEPVAGEWHVDAEYWARLRDKLADAVKRRSATDPLDPGIPMEAARSLLGLPDRRLVEALVEPPLRIREGRVYGAQRDPVLPPEVAAAVEAVRKELTASPYRAPDAGRLAELGLTSKLLAAAVRAGALLRIGDDIVLLPGADLQAARTLARLEQPFTASEARQALDTTRRVAIPLLEHLDRKGITRRIDTTHRRCRDPDVDR